MSQEYQIYRMWYQLAHAVRNGEIAGAWKPSDMTFKGRTQKEAQNKANRFWRDAELGTGAMLCVLEGQRP